MNKFKIVIIAVAGLILFRTMGLIRARYYKMGVEDSCTMFINDMARQQGLIGTCHIVEINGKQILTAKLKHPNGFFSIIDVQTGEILSTGMET